MFTGHLRGQVIVIQHSTQALPSLDRFVGVCRNSLGRYQSVANSLMIPLQVVMCHELPDRLPQRTLAKEDQSIQARLLDGPHKAFRMGVQVGGTRRQLHRLDSNIREHIHELRREQRVAIMDQIPLSKQQTIDGIAEIPSDLAHPQPVGLSSVAGDDYLWSDYWSWNRHRDCRNAEW
jgi:hypothetical protein